MKNKRKFSLILIFVLIAAMISATYLSFAESQTVTQEEYDKAHEKIIALAVKWKQSAERERYVKEEAKEKDREKLKAERKKSKKKGNGGNK